jgi:hypothetical protein
MGVGGGVNHLNVLNSWERALSGHFRLKLQ